jgi:hypothetical protein
MVEFIEYSTGNRELLTKDGSALGYGAFRLRVKSLRISLAIMTSPNQDPKDSLFPTPNPQELKAQSEQGSLREQYPDLDTEDNNEAIDEIDTEDGESYFEDEQTRALSSSPIINANISGG